MQKHWFGFAVGQAFAYFISALITRQLALLVPCVVALVAALIWQCAPSKSPKG